MISIYSPQSSPRLSYTLRVLFEVVCRVDYNLFHSKEDFERSEGVKLNYSHEILTDCLQVRPGKLLFQENIEPQIFRTGSMSETPVIFLSENPAAFPFDIFSACFFMITRYEEYLGFRPDRHGRFPGVQNTAVKLGAEKKALVHRWTKLLTDELKLKKQGLVIEEPMYSFQPTYDIDNAYAYKYKSPVRTIAGLAKNLIINPSSLSKRLNILRGRDQDPYDTYDYIKSVSEQYGVRPKTFVLTAGFGKYDKNINPRNKHFKELIKKIETYSDVGIHPSYRSSSNHVFPKAEYEHLNFHTRNEVEISRQHFLRFRFPQTFQSLLEAGIKADYSLGFAEHSGFRAGMARPFPYFDLTRNAITNLMIHPFCFMESSYQYYHTQSTHEIQPALKEIIDECRLVRGEFNALWHNESLCDEGIWKGWKTLFEWMHEYATP